MKWGGMLFASLLMASSCQNEEIITGEKQGNYSLKVSSMVDSRTYVADNGQVLWSEGDKLYVYGNNVSGVLTLNAADAGKDEGTFSGFVFGNPENLKWAVFGDEVKGTTNGAQFTISEISDPNSNSPMVGEIKGGNVDLEHLCGMVRITINNLPKNADVKLVGDNIAGTAEWNGTSMSVQSTSDEIKINVENGNQTIEVPVFAEEAEATKNFKLVVNGKECPFSAPVAIGALSEKAIMYITCITDDNGNVTGFTQAATTKESLIQALQTEGTVSFQLSDDMILDETVVIGDKTTAIIDLNDKTLSLGTNYIQNKGTLTIENGSLIADTFNETTNGAPLWNNGGDLTIKDGTTISGFCSAVRNESGNTTIEGGTLIATCNTGNTSSSIIRMKGGTLTINNGTFIGCADINGSEGCSIINPTGGTTTINGGHFSNFSSSPGSIFANALTGVTVKGGTFEFTPVDNWEPEQSFTEKGYLADGYTVVAGDGVCYIVAGEEDENTTVVTSKDALEEAIKNTIDNTKDENVIYLDGGTYTDDINLTIAELGSGTKGNIVFKAMPGTNPIIAGTVTLGYRNHGVGSAMWDADVTFEGITFDHAEPSKHSINVGDVKSITLKDCKIIGDGEYGISSERENATVSSSIIGCTFENAGMQVLGQFGNGLEIDDCTFNESRVNVQGGVIVNIKNSTFNNTLTSNNIGDSFYLVRSNDIAINIEDCEMNIDSDLTEIATNQAKWAILWQRNAGGTKWTVDGLEVNLTDAAMAQTSLLFNLNGTTTEANKEGRITITDLTSESNNVTDIIAKSEGYLKVGNDTYLNGVKQ